MGLATPDHLLIRGANPDHLERAGVDTPKVVSHTI